MQLSIEAIPEVPVGNNGVLIRVRDEEGNNVGRLWIGQAHVRWARGSIQERNAKKLPMHELVEILDGL